MAVLVTKPGKYARCICCGSDLHDMHEFQFFQDIGIKTCITLCSNCVTNMYKESQKEGVENDKRPENN